MSNNCLTRSPIPGQNVCTTKVIVLSASFTSMSNTPTSTQINAVQQISVMANLLWTLQRDAKEQAMAYLKNVAGLDF